MCFVFLLTLISFNIAENVFTNLMIFILEDEDVEYDKHDKNILIYGYTVPDLSTILQICFNGDVSPTVVAKKATD